MRDNNTEYFTIPELGDDRPMFWCSRRQAKLQMATCASMWHDGNSKHAPEHLSKCRACPIGAMHADAGEISGSPLYGSGICARCHRSGNRLVGDDICVSCWNRQREYLIGRNAKGVPPKLHPKLFEVCVRMSVGGKVKRVTRDRCAAVEEVVVAALRDEPKRVMFSFGAEGPKVPGGRQESLL